MKDVPDTNVVSLAVGQTTTYFVTADNLAYSFGIGVLGDSKFFSSGTPVRIKTTALNGNVISAVVAIGPSAFIIDKSGNWYAWGTNEYVTADPN
jgi:alpha-tubulin suppressor-like RCC1 family protein